MNEKFSIEAYTIGRRDDRPVKRTCIRYHISPEEYALADSKWKHWASEEKTGPYGGGISDKPSLYGCLGEIASGELFEVKYDLDRKPQGDEHDLMLKPGKVDIKCATRNYWEILIMYLNEDGTVNGSYTKKKDFYVATFLDPPTPVDPTNPPCVVFVGYVTRQQVENAKVEYGKPSKARWQNRVIPYEETRPIGELINLHFSEN